VTAEGCATDLADGDVAILRYWFSERTHWLVDVFGQPEPLDAPESRLTGPASALSTPCYGKRRGCSAPAAC
jgi:hypothetical protein